jgi:aspartyl-tRNA(Asn)/glutamyl-tRNA(Gln) amidotransferase subunit A
MGDTERIPTAAAELAATIAQLAGGLALAEEPSGFVAALESDPDARTAVARLREAGAVTLGKLNMTELALGPFGDNAHHGDVQNPWKRGHVAGGSSSGSAAAVAAGFVAGAMLARTVTDAALLLGVIAGHDPRDATSSRRGVPYDERVLQTPIEGLRVGIAENYYVDGLDPEMEAGVRAAAHALAGLGVEVAPLRVPDPGPLIEVCNVITRSESSAIHAALVRERPHELQPAVRARLEVGFHISAHDYLQALRLRARAAREFVARVFARVDALLLPAIPEPAPALETAKAGTPEEVVGRMGRFSRFTRPFNGLGLPALSVPCGFSRDGRPLAVQLVGRPFDEATALRLGHAYEQAAGWTSRRPALD